MSDRLGDNSPFSSANDYEAFSSVKAFEPSFLERAWQKVWVPAQFEREWKRIEEANVALDARRKKIEREEAGNQKVALSLMRRETEVEALLLKLGDLQQKFPDYDAALAALEEIARWEAELGREDRRLEAKRRELEGEEDRLGTWNVRLSGRSRRLDEKNERMEGARRELKQLRAELRKYRRRWDEVSQDLDAELQAEFLSFALSEHPEGALIAPDPAESFYKQALEQTIDLLLGQLSDKERKVIELRFGFRAGGPRTYAEIGGLCGVSGVAVKQRIEKGLRKLRHPIRSRQLLDYR